MRSVFTVHSAAYIYPYPTYRPRVIHVHTVFLAVILPEPYDIRTPHLPLHLAGVPCFRHDAGHRCSFSELEIIGRSDVSLEAKFRKSVELIVNIDGIFSQKGLHGLEEYILKILINFGIFGIYREYIATYIEIYSA